MFYYASTLRHILDISVQNASKEVTKEEVFLDHQISHTSYRDQEAIHTQLSYDVIKRDCA